MAKAKKLSKLQVNRKISSLSSDKIKELAVQFDLNQNQMIFALEYMKSGNATQSYAKAYNKDSKDTSVRNMASQLKDKAKIVNFISTLGDELFDLEDDKIANPFDIMYSLSSIINNDSEYIYKYNELKSTFNEYIKTKDDDLLSVIDELLHDVRPVNIKQSDKIAASKLLMEIYDRIDLFNSDSYENNDTDKDNLTVPNTLSEAELEQQILSEVYGD